MRNLFSSIFILATCIAFSQTTLEEYNYLTKGYPETLEKGLDLKQGYSLVEEARYSIYNTDYIYYAFIFDETGAKKAYLVDMEKQNKKKRRFLCIPIGSKKLAMKFVDAKGKLGVTIGYGFEYSYSIFTGMLMQAYEISQKKV